MKRWLTTAAALAVTASIAATLGAAATKPYVGVWKARVTADQLLDNGIAQPQFKGVWKLTLAKDGTYRTYNPWDKWSSGVYSANAHPDRPQQGRRMPQGRAPRAGHLPLVVHERQVEARERRDRERPVRRTLANRLDPALDAGIDSDARRVHAHALTPRRMIGSENPDSLQCGSRPL